MNIEKIIYIVLGTVLIGLLIFLTFIFTPSGLVSQNEKKITTIYFADNISPAHEKVIKIFNERYKNTLKVETINLSFEKFSTNERKELLARYLRSRNNRIDIFAVDQIWVPRFARWAVPLQNLLDSSEVKNIIPNALETCIYKDTLVAVPLYIDIAVMLYRDDLIKNLPEYSKITTELKSNISWEQFIDLHQNLSYLKNPFYVFQADDYEGLICVYTELMASQGNPIVNRAGEILINTPESRKSLQLLVDLVNKYQVSPSDVTYLKENESFKYFVQNDALFLRIWSSMIDDKIEYLTEEMRSNFRIAETPHFKDTKPSAVYGGWNLMISQFSEKIPDVIKFLKFLISEESQKIMFEEGKYLPTNKKLYDDAQFVSSHNDLNYFKNLYKIGVHRPFVERYTNISDVLSYYINLAIKGSISVNDALEQADEKIKAKAVLVK